jgi:hypothetical protein
MATVLAYGVIISKASIAALLAHEPPTIMRQHALVTDVYVFAYMFFLDGLEWETRHKLDQRFGRPSHVSVSSEPTCSSFQND